jgi:hypothetical protein
MAAGMKCSALRTPGEKGEHYFCFHLRIGWFGWSCEERKNDIWSALEMDEWS